MSSSANGIGNGKAKKRRRRIILASIAALVLVGGGYGVFAALRPNHDIDPSKLAEVERGDLARVVVATGKIQPLSKVEVKSKASGLVKKLFVDYGDRVKQGDVLAELDKVQLEAIVREAQANYQAAQAARDSSLAALERNKVDAEGPDVPFLKLSMDRAQQMLKDGVSDESAIDELYWSTLAREPGEEEKASLLKHVTSAPDRRKGLEDVLWALLNSKEFVLRR